MAEKRWKEAQKKLGEYMERLRQIEEGLFYKAFENLLGGKSVDEAAIGVLREASHYRREEVILNLIMLDQRHRLRELVGSKRSQKRYFVQY